MGGAGLRKALRSGSGREVRPDLAVGLRRPLSSVAFARVHPGIRSPLGRPVPAVGTDAWMLPERISTRAAD